MKAIRKPEPTSPGQIHKSTEGSSMSINQEQHQNHQRQQSGVMILFRIISRFDWDRLQEYHAACPGSTIEHLMHGLFVLTIPAGGATALGGAA